MANHVNGLDEIDMEYTLDAWGDVPPLHARELYAQYDATRAEFVAPDTCHKLHARIAELERERDAAQGALEFAQRYWMDAIAERDAANHHAATNHETTAKILSASKSKDKIIAGLNQKIISANARAESAERERNESQRANGILAQNVIDANSAAESNFDLALTATSESLRSVRLFKQANAKKRQMRHERDAANKRAKEYVGVFKRVNAAKRVWRKRAEQAEAELVEAQSRLIAGAVYEKLDSINYWKTRAEQAEADARALAERVFDTELFGDKEAEIMFRYLPREQMNGAGYKNEETI